MLESHRKALEELRKVSEELYQAALKPDETLLPLDCKGPTETPPIAGYKVPDGDYVDTTRKWE